VVVFAVVVVVRVARGCQRGWQWRERILVLSLMFADANLQWRWCFSGVRGGCNGGCESGSSMEDGRVVAAAGA